MTTAVRFQALPPLSPDEYQALEQSIAEHGVMVPIIVDEHDVVIDGHHRQKIASEHGLFCPKRTLRDLDDAAKRTMALSLNLDRRHLTREQRRALVAESIKADPQLSDREHGRRTGVDHKTAATVRDEMEGRGEIPHVSERVDSAGRQQPSSKPPRPVIDVPEQQLPPLPDNYMDLTASTASDTTPITPAAPKEPRRKAITEAFDTASYELRRVVERVVRLTEDDRFKKNKDQITGSNLSDLIRVRDALNGVIQHLEG